MDPSLTSLLRKEIDVASSFSGCIKFQMNGNEEPSNIMEFCSKKYYSRKEGIDHPSSSQAFHSKIYPPTEEGFQRLKQGLISAARSSGQ